jgi:hypothetical protein
MVATLTGFTQDRQALFIGKTLDAVLASTGPTDL